VKILVVSNLYPPDFIGGYEIACAQVVDALRCRGHSVTVLTAVPRTPVAAEPHVLRRLQLTEESNWSDSDPWFIPLCRRLRDASSRFFNAYNVHRLTTTLDELQPDLVYVCNLIGLGGLGLIACLNHLKVPWVWQLGDNVPGKLCGKYEGTYQAIADEFSRQIQGHYIVVSQQLIQQIKQSGVTLHGDVEVIPNWIVGERPPARTSFYRGGTLRIMSVGHLVQWGGMGIGILIEAAARLRDGGHSNFVMDIYGKVHSPLFANLIRKFDIAGHVSLKGVRPQPEIMRLYRDYDVFAFATMEREPFGLVPLEAAGRGCVPVLTQRCGIAEWLVQGVHCLKAARNPEAFAGVFRAILEGRIDLGPIARRAQVTAWRDFHIDAILPRIERKLAAAARQPRTGAGTAAEVYRMARLAEQLTQVLYQEQAALPPQPEPKERDAVPDLAFYNAGCSDARGVRRVVVLARRLLRRVLRPIFAHQVVLFQYLIDRLDRYETALRGDIESLTKRQEELAERVETIQAFGWDYVAMVRRLAALEDHLATMNGQAGPPFEDGDSRPSILFPGFDDEAQARSKVS
jgi:glycosyltransferase involved in cell wall biosynthesis